MKGIFVSFALGLVAGAVAFKKMEDNKVPEKALKAARDKMEKQ